MNNKIEITKVLKNSDEYTEEETKSGKLYQVGLEYNGKIYYFSKPVGVCKDLALVFNTLGENPDYPAVDSIKVLYEEHRKAFNEINMDYQTNSSDTQTIFTKVKNDEINYTKKEEKVVKKELEDKKKKVQEETEKEFQATPVVAPIENVKVSKKGKSLIAGGLVALAIFGGVIIGTNFDKIKNIFKSNKITNDDLNEDNIRKVTVDFTKNFNKLCDEKANSKTLKLQITEEETRLFYLFVNYKNYTEEQIANVFGKITNPSEVARKITNFVTQVTKYEGLTNEKVDIDGDKFSPQEISAMILQKLKADAENYLGQKVTQAVITVPAYFNDSQRQATKDAGKIAGLEVLRIINEPTAAALAYGMDKEQDQKILIYDLGGGTFDVSILDIGDGVFEVLATNGNTHLGGDDFDEAIINYLVDEFKKSNGIDLKTDKMAMQRLKEAAEKAKIELSGVQQTQINLPFITADSTGPKHLDVTLTRSKFEELIHDLVEATAGPVNQALKDAGLSANDIHKVLLVGGSTRVPAVQEAVKRITGKEADKGINPDECVAIGAAIQGGVLSGDVKDLVLLDVTPLSLGIETYGGVFTKLIERNTTIPTKKSQIFSTAADGQTSVEVHVLQGEREMAAYNKTLGRFQLTGIPAAPRGVPQIEVTFDIDANGIVHVSAKDMATGNSQDVSITASTNLTDEDIDKAVKDAEAHAEEDKKKKEEIEVKNNAESLIYNSEKTLKDLGDKISGEEKAKVETEIDNTKKALETNDTDKIKEATEKLTKVFYDMSEQLYKNANPNGAQGAGTDANAGEGPKTDGNGNVYDADYKVEDDNKE